MSDPDESLSADDQAALARLRESVAKAKQSPEHGKHKLANPDKFSGPIGADSEGRIATVPTGDDEETT